MEYSDRVHWMGDLQYIPPSHKRIRRLQHLPRIHEWLYSKFSNTSSKASLYNCRACRPSFITMHTSPISTIAYGRLNMSRCDRRQVTACSYSAITACPRSSTNINHWDIATDNIRAFARAALALPDSHNS